MVIHIALAVYPFHPDMVRQQTTIFPVPDSKGINWIGANARASEVGIEWELGSHQIVVRYWRADHRRIWRWTICTGKLRSSYREPTLLARRSS